jgi:hypothetical protein
MALSPRKRRADLESKERVGNAGGGYAKLMLKVLDLAVSGESFQGMDFFASELETSMRSGQKRLIQEYFAIDTSLSPKRRLGAVSGEPKIVISMLVEMEPSG